MAVTYFGQCDSSGTATANDGNVAYTYATDWIAWTNLEFTCPGSGNQTIRQISAYLYDNDNDGSAVARFGVYDTSGDLVVDCGTVNITRSTAGWTDLGDGSTSDLGTLTGGTDYQIAVAISGAALAYPVLCYTTGDLGDGARASGTDYVAAMPETLPAAEYNGYKKILRVGVETAGGGGSTQGPRSTSYFTMNW